MLYKVIYAQCSVKLAVFHKYLVNIKYVCSNSFRKRDTLELTLRAIETKT